VSAAGRGKARIVVQRGVSRGGRPWARVHLPGDYTVTLRPESADVPRADLIAVAEQLRADGHPSEWRPGPSAEDRDIEESVERVSSLLALADRGAA
jgi:hypothetical protein